MITIFLSLRLTTFINHLEMNKFYFQPHILVNSQALSTYSSLGMYTYKLNQV